MYNSKIEKAKFCAFLGTLLIAVVLTKLGLDWFYAGFFVGVIVGAALFEGPLDESRNQE
jgi:hypothetical protein